ncbi:MAG: sulfite exporter TauE/SafE family protein [Labilithrix sp.]|nr:sulfite exporter TauE/SafE family protein [Labilithrix sp.]
MLAAMLALAIGVVLGMLGGGGAILTLPMLVLVLGVPPKTAIAMSLFVVGTTSLVGCALHARAGRVRWKIGAIFGAGGMTGAFAGGRLAHYVPASVLMLGFAAIMLLTAAAMLRDTVERERPARTLALGRALVLGAAVGVVSGLVGAGGGFLIVPALTLLGGLAVREAVATSLLVISMQSFAGFAGHFEHVVIDWRLAGIVTAATILGTVAGSSIGQSTSPATLKRAFAWLVLGMGSFIFGAHLPIAATVVVVVGVLAFALTARAVRGAPASASRRE